MKKETLIIAILVALIILWITETIGMKKTSRLLSGAIRHRIFTLKIGAAYLLLGNQAYLKA